MRCSSLSTTSGPVQWLFVRGDRLRPIAAGLAVVLVSAAVLFGAAVLNRATSSVEAGDGVALTRSHPALDVVAVRPKVDVGERLGGYRSGKFERLPAAAAVAALAFASSLFLGFVVGNRRGRRPTMFLALRTSPRGPPFSLVARI